MKNIFKISKIVNILLFSQNCNNIIKNIRYNLYWKSKNKI